jgi:hypothetical protein
MEGNRYFHPALVSVNARGQAQALIFIQRGAPVAGERHTLLEHVESRMRAPIVGEMSSEASETPETSGRRPGSPIEIGDPGEQGLDARVAVDVRVVCLADEVVGLGLQFENDLAAASRKHQHCEGGERDRPEQAGSPVAEERPC